MPSTEPIKQEKGVTADVHDSDSFGDILPKPQLCCHTLPSLKVCPVFSSEPAVISAKPYASMIARYVRACTNRIPITVTIIRVPCTCEFHSTRDKAISIEWLHAPIHSSRLSA